MLTVLESLIKILLPDFRSVVMLHGRGLGAVAGGVGLFFNSAPLLFPSLVDPLLFANGFNIGDLAVSADVLLAPPLPFIGLLRSYPVDRSFTDDLSVSVVDFFTTLLRLSCSLDIVIDVSLSDVLAKLSSISREPRGLILETFVSVLRLESSLASFIAALLQVSFAKDSPFATDLS